jgi:bifunctional non-homologous end joining protein LigD
MIQSTILYRPDGSSELVYHLCLKPRGGGYVVNFAHGLRATKLCSDTATPTPVHYDHAQQIYAQLVAERSAQGYLVQERSRLDTESGDIDGAVRPRPIRPVDIDISKAEKLISNHEWWLQEKYEGKHLLIRKSDVTVDGVDGAGMIVPLPAAVTNAAKKVPFRWVMEGVCLDDTFTVFDLAQFEMMNFRGLTYMARLTALRKLLHRPSPHLNIAETGTEFMPKLRLLKRLREEGSKGIVLRKLNGVLRRGGLAVDGYLLEGSFV